MDKKHTIWKLRDAKRAHIKWVERAYALIEGLPLDKNQVPVESTACDFGTWYYSDGQALSVLPSFKSLESSHAELHSTYMQIFKLLFTESKQSMFGKLFGRAAKVSEAQRDNARVFYRQLQQISQQVIDGLEELEKELMTLEESKVEALV